MRPTQRMDRILVPRNKLKSSPVCVQSSKHSTCHLLVMSHHLVWDSIRLSTLSHLGYQFHIFLLTQWGFCPFLCTVSIICGCQSTKDYSVENSISKMKNLFWSAEPPSLIQLHALSTIHQRQKQMFKFVSSLFFCPNRTHTHTHAFSLFNKSLTRLAIQKHLLKHWLRHYNTQLNLSQHYLMDKNDHPHLHENDLMKLKSLCI